MRTAYLVCLCLVVALSFVLTSCAPSIHYLGESYAPKAEVDVFYDENDVKRPYKVIGKMTNDQFIDLAVDEVKVMMIEKAKQVGGDAIVFTDLGVNRTETEGERLAVKAKLLKYED